MNKKTRGIFNFNFLYCRHFLKRKIDAGGNLTHVFPENMCSHSLLPHSQNPLVFHYRTILHLVQLSQVIRMKYGTVICSVYKYNQFFFFTNGGYTNAL